MEMKNNTIRNLIISFLLIFSSLMHSQNLDPYQFFPANIGDRWEYTWAGPDVKYTVIRDSIDMKDSSRFVFFYDPPLYYGANYRIDRKYNVFNVPQFDNLHEYKLDAQIGESWVVVVLDPNKWEEARVSSIYESFVFGKLTTIKEIQHYQCRKTSDSLIDTTLIDVRKLAYGFGLISKENYVLQPYLLKGCRINGVTYGTVDVKEEPKIVPSEFVLYQNYPNPFNPTTVIGYQLPVTEHVTLRVLDLLGREIITLVNEEKTPGNFEVTFNAETAQPEAGKRGESLPSGVYFYNLTTGSNSITKKMLLVK